MTRFPSVVYVLAGLVLAGAVAAGPLPARAQAAPGTVVSTPEGDVTVIADHIEQFGPDNLLIATGNVEITRGNTRLVADRVELNRETGAATATGRAVFFDGEDRLVGDRIDYNVKTGTGVVYQGSAQAPPYYHIAGQRMERLDPNVYHVRQGVFTTCEDDPPTWSVRFGTGTADLESIVYGTNASFWVKQVPLIPFIPFFAAAIRRERQTGFLIPVVGSSSRKGTFAEIPFFWAISESQDATITLNAYERRGLGGHLEYRYLLSATNRGQFTGFFINESVRDNPETPQGREVPTGRSENRGWFRLRHDWQLPAGLTLRADINGVTDDFVFRDYGDPLPERAAQRVESNVFLTRRWSTWNFVGNLFWYEDLTQNSAVELNRLPDLRLQAVRQPLPGPTGILYELESSAINFVRDVGSDGTRLDLHPRFSRPVPVFGYFTLTPFVGGRFTGYDTGVSGTRVTKDGFTVETTDGEPQLRRLVELGTDFEMRAARIYSLGGFGGVDAVLHSIEPRVNYTWIEGSDLVRIKPTGATRPNHLPQWDAVDAITDSSLVTYSLINRIRARTVAPEGTEPTRWELLRVTLGQTYDLLNDARPFGLISGDAILNPGQLFSARATAAYNIYGEGLKTLTTDLGINSSRLSGTVGTRLARDVVVVDPSGKTENRPAVSFLQGNLVAHLTPHLVARLTTNWDMKEDVFVENRIGIDLRWQCWAFSIDYVKRHNDEDELKFALNLLGVGTPIRTGSRFGDSGGAGGTK